MAPIHLIMQIANFVVVRLEQNEPLELQCNCTTTHY